MRSSTIIFCLVSISLSPQVASGYQQEQEGCYAKGDKGLGYRGDVRQTETGLNCQMWSVQSPHQHTRTPENYPLAGLESNYCRNPDNSDRPWCYTTDASVRWKYCNVPLCEGCYDASGSGQSNGLQPCPDHCYNEFDSGSSYRGTTMVTATGKKCQNWNSQSPHSHTRTPENYPNSGLVENYCRNPDSSNRPWCYTMEAGTRWEYCDVPKCSETCGANEVRIGNYCYWLDVKRWNTYSYDMAVAKCAETGSTVTDIFSHQHYNQISVEIRKKIPSDWEHVMMWTNLRSDPTTGKVTLSGGSPAPYVQWQQDEPSRQPTDTNILMTVFHDAGNAWEGMEDFQPSYRGHGFVCQRPLATCKKNEVLVGQDCYWLDIKRWNTYSYDSSVSQCATTGSSVTDILSKNHYNLVSAEIRKKIPSDWEHVMMWTNLRSDPATGEVTLSNGSPAPYVQWQQDEPSRQPTDTNILMTVFHDAGNAWEGMEDFQPSYRGHGFVCQRPIMSCNDNEVLIGQYCYWLDVKVWNTYSYDSAVSQCATTGSKVADIFGENHYNLVSAEIRKKIPADWEHVMMWTNLRSNPTTGKVTLSDGSPAPYVKWQQDEPSRQATDTNVLMTVFHDAGNAWEGMEDFQPSYRGHGFVCQRLAS